MLLRGRASSTSINVLVHGETRALGVATKQREAQGKDENEGSSGPGESRSRGCRMTLGPWQVGLG